MPDLTEIQEYRAYVAQFPAEDSPELYGLHPNVAISCRLRAMQSFVSTLVTSQQGSRVDAGAAFGGEFEEQLMKRVATVAAGLPSALNTVGGSGDEASSSPALTSLSSRPLSLFLQQEIKVCCCSWLLCCCHSLMLSCGVDRESHHRHGGGTFVGGGHGCEGPRTAHA